MNHNDLIKRSPTFSDNEGIRDTDPLVEVPTSGEPGRTKVHVKQLLSLFMAINFLSYFDRGLISGVLTKIKSDDRMMVDGETLSDAKAGIAVSAFMAGFMICSPIFASVGGRFRPSYICAFGLVVWCGAVVLTSLSSSYAMLVSIRSLVGIGEAAYCGFIPTMIDDIAPASVRTFYIGLYFAMIPVGAAVGMAAGGVLGGYDHILGFRGWQFPFAAEGVFMLPLVLCIMRVPPSVGNGSTAKVSQKKLENVGINTLADDRASQSSWSLPPATLTVEKQSYPSALKAVTSLVKNPLFLLTSFGYAMYTLVLGGVSAWGIAFLEQGQLNMSSGGASVTFGLVTAVTGLAGTAVGGWYVDNGGGSKGNVGMIRCHWFNIIAIFISVPFGIGAFLMPSVPPFVCLVFVAEFALFATTSPVNAILLESVSAEMRTYAMTFSILIIHAAGDFPSPILIGAVSDLFSEGCPDHKDKLTCLADVDSHCKWCVSDDKNTKSICRNETQLRNALLICYAILFVAPMLWGVALTITKSKKSKEYEEDIDAEAE
eukprot:TRINITY_DN1190_c0_g2_i1.p1 TRINITY_DN1190_c0_g2~~TRINITY_DN1190_c0_g2_i1.p1  ORF type:complete len:542 (+),score=74.16 TRINITY_DN1190_c0_g2_i1:68-1693(+)